MSAEKRRVLIVDDNPTEIHLLMETLKHDYATQVATSGDKALDIIASGFVPDIILMDAVMPGMDGYEACMRIKASTDCQRTDVLFISAHDSLEEKLAGYEAGASDYLVKPISPDELLQKLKLAIRQKVAREKLRGEVDSAVETARMALSASDEQCVVMDNLRKCIGLTAPAAVARQLMVTLANLGLQGCTRLALSQGQIEDSSDGVLSPVERSLLEGLARGNPLPDQRRQQAFLRGAVVLLIRNMPDAGEKRQRLEEHLETLVDAAATRIQCLLTEKKTTEDDDLLRPYIRTQATGIDHLVGQMRHHRETVMHILDQMMRTIEADFTSLGFSEKQERLLMSLLQEGVDAMHAHCEDGHRMDEQLAQYLNELKLYAS